MIYKVLNVPNIFGYRSVIIAGVERLVLFHLSCGLVISGGSTMDRQLECLDYFLVESGTLTLQDSIMTMIPG